MDKPILHYICHAIADAFSVSKWAELKSLNHAESGWIGVLRCKITGKVYKIGILEIESEKEVIKPSSKLYQTGENRLIEIAESLANGGKNGKY